ncbi:hypothetical protein Acy02nite_15170 [Actinoplanes cyaneus]|uniref:Uncharacterized protein n=1 Tax=Actinoplanes cyaneus TaxID=52696 RepID=A0A919MA30_9ACTN|nr:hypothetical protein [Actinoplanes cyaneus]GID63636.1 hypothetical protein Acy02nite_15170 [Actinoplanes cyaneus]
MMGAVVIALSIWTVSSAAFLLFSSPARTPRIRAWRFTPLLTAGFAIPVAAAYALGDVPTVMSLLAAAVASAGVLHCLPRPAEA